jgi:hypothetical protein
MGLLQNGYRLGFSPFVRRLGALTTIYNGGGDLHTNRSTPGVLRGSYGTFGAYAGRPIGNLNPASWMIPQKAGAMSMRTDGTGTFAGDLFPSYPMSIDLTGSGDLAATAGLVVSMIAAFTGSGSMTASIEGRLNMTCDLTGTGDLSADLSGIAGMVIAMLGTGDLEATISAFGDMTIDIVVTGTGLSTANVGQAVWAALAASNNDPGTMGEKMNDAGSASNPWTEVIESGYTAEQILRLIAASLAGKVSGAETSNIQFTGLDGVTTRIDATVDTNGNRTSITLDGT